MRRILLLSVVLLLPLAYAAAGANRVYTVSVVPQLSVTELYRDWSPLLTAISKSSGLKLRLQLADSIPEFESQLLLGKYDFAYANPFHAVIAESAQHYRPLMRDGSRRLKGILVVRRDSGINDVRQLQNRTIAFPSPNAFAASLYMRTLLTNKEQLNFVPKYAESHTNTILHVLLGKADAGAVVVRTLEKQRPEARELLKIVYTTPEILPHPILVHPQIDASVAERFQRALVDLQRTAEGQQLLASVNIPDPVPSNYAEYKGLESLKLNYFLQIHQYREQP